MNHRPENDYLRVNKTGKYTRESIFHQIHANANVNVIPQPPQPEPKKQVYIIDKSDFKSIVQQLTSNQSSCELLPQNLPNPQNIRPEPLNLTSSVAPEPTVLPVSLHMRYLQSLLEESSESNGDQFQQPFYENQSHMLAQPQVLKQSMTYSNGLTPVMSTTLTSPWFDGLPELEDGAYSLQSTRVEYSQPLTPDLTFSSMSQHEIFNPDRGQL